MRIRTIKPEFWTNERMAALPPFTQLAAIALLNWSDDDGYFLANPSVIRGALFPYLTSCTQIHGALTELQEIDYLRLQKSNDSRLYGFIVNFKKHQRVNRPNESAIKGICDFSLPSAFKFSESSVSTHGALTAGMEGKGREGKYSISETAQKCAEISLKVPNAENHCAAQTANDERIANGQTNGAGAHKHDSGQSVKGNKRKENAAPFNGVKIWCDCYKSRYHATPAVTGKDAGLLTAYAKITPEPQFKAILKRYLNNPTQSYCNAGHPVSILSATWNRWLSEVKNAAYIDPQPPPEKQDDDGFFKMANGGVVPT